MGDGKGSASPSVEDEEGPEGNITCEANDIKGHLTQSFGDIDAGSAICGGDFTCPILAQLRGL